MTLYKATKINTVGAEITHDINITLPAYYWKAEVEFSAEVKSV